MNIAISIYRPRPFSGLLKTLSFHSLSDDSFSFFFFFFYQMSIFLRVTENPLPLSNDNAPVIEISSAGDSKSYIWIRLRGNKGIWYSLVFREEQLAREK